MAGMEVNDNLIESVLIPDQVEDGVCGERVFDRFVRVIRGSLKCFGAAMLLCAFSV